MCYECQLFELENDNKLIYLRNYYEDNNVHSYFKLYLNWTNFFTLLTAVIGGHHSRMIGMCV